MTDTSKVLQKFFWFAFAVFLAASIPHVAYFFRAYEPTGEGVEGFAWWSVSYLIATTIDVTIFLLSVTVAQLQRQHKSTGLILSVWVFIVGLAGLSWFINDKYALHFKNTGMISPTSLTLPGGVFITDINPLIASCFLVLSVAYTWISDKITANESPKTSEQLKQEVDELEAVSKQRARLKELHKGRVTNATTDAIDGVASIVGHALSKVSKRATQDVQLLPAQVQEEATNGPTTDALEAINTASTSATDTANEDVQLLLSEGIKETSKTGMWDGFTSHSTVPVETASKMLNVSINQVKTLRSKGTLRHAARNQNLITIASLKAYYESRSKRNQSKVIEADKPTLSLVRSVSEIDSEESNNTTLETHSM
jgi:hypothetical protein